MLCAVPRYAVPRRKRQPRGPVSGCSVGYRRFGARLCGLVHSASRADDGAGGRSPAERSRPCGGTRRTVARRNIDAAFHAAQRMHPLRHRACRSGKTEKEGRMRHRTAYSSMEAPPPRSLRDA